MRTGKQRKQKRLQNKMAGAIFNHFSDAKKYMLNSLFGQTPLYKWLSGYQSKHKKRKFKRGYIPKVESISQSLGEADASAEPLEPGSSVVWNLHYDEGKGKCDEEPTSL